VYTYMHTHTHTHTHTYSDDAHHTHRGCTHTDWSVNEYIHTYTYTCTEVMHQD
jgi:hypothetical protein